VSTSPGQTFFNAHVGYLMSNDLDALVKEQYTEDAVLISPFDVLDTPPPHTLRGRQEIKNFLGKWLAYHGPSQFESLTNFVETEDSISFHSIMVSQTGRWMLGEAWHVVGGLPNGQIDRHYGFAYKIS
jgi:ketosteroid isomerase-like protein